MFDVEVKIYILLSEFLLQITTTMIQTLHIKDESHLHFSLDSIESDSRCHR